MATITLPTTFADNTVPTAAQFNGDFNAIVNEFNGSITNANLSASAAISPSKISGTAATLTGSETLTNKVLTKPTINGSIGAFTTDTDGATVTFNMSESNVHTVTLGGNRTLAVSNTSVGQSFVVRLIQDGTGSRTVTWFSTIKWPGGTTPTLTTTAAKIDVFGFICTSSGNFDGFTVGTNL